MGTILQAIRAGAEALASAGVPDPGRDARRLMGYLVGRDGAGLFAVERDPLDARIARDYGRLIARRAARQPLAQIVGHRDF